jgi:glutathione synthase/RimK-type ligase-like ATP-grasp enzyme
MILVISHKNDFSADFLVNKLNQRALNYRRLNCEDILTVDATFRFKSGFSYSLLEEGRFDSVWFRRTKLPELQGLSVAEANYVLVETDSLLKNIFSTLSARWLSSPNSVYRAESKLLQLRTAHDIGFSIPETLVTNSKEEVRQFYRELNGRVIVKPLSQTRLNDGENTSFIFTSEVSPDVLERISDLDLTPCIFQENVPKLDELRVTVVGDEVFAAKVNSQDFEETRTDWRKKELHFEPIKLPSFVADLCTDLLRSLKLKFGAIDLIRTPDGKYIFLEINPNGQWVWIENHTSLKISDAIIRYLTHD